MERWTQHETPPRSVGERIWLSRSDQTTFSHTYNVELICLFVCYYCGSVSIHRLTQRWRDSEEAGTPITSSKLQQLCPGQLTSCHILTTYFSGVFLISPSLPCFGLPTGPFQQLLYALPVAVMRATYVCPSNLNLFNCHGVGRESINLQPKIIIIIILFVPFHISGEK
jgi:hypothetical protein